MIKISEQRYKGKCDCGKIIECDESDTFRAGGEKFYNFRYIICPNCCRRVTLREVVLAMLSKEEITKQDWQKLCDECSNVAKEAGLTKEDTDRILKETRTMQWKAKKYDELIDKLEADKMEQFDDYVIYLIESYLAILKGER